MSRRFYIRRLFIAGPAPFLESNKQEKGNHANAANIPENRGNTQLQQSPKA
jgi:hypothetical protein